jgi:hypothetical protein
VFAETDRGICQNPNSPMPISEIQTALTVALYEWVVHGTPPPDSRFPTVANGGLVPAADVAFPHIPGVTYNASYNPLEVRDFSSIPPESGAAYTVLVGRVDADGNMIDGVRHPHLMVPLGTYTGWNLRREGFGEGDQCAGSGSFMPFAYTRAEREASGDPRLSIEERYSTPQAYLYRVAAAAGELVRERLLLPQDAEEIVEVTEDNSVGR